MKRAATKHGVKCIYLAFNDDKAADKHGAALRTQIIGSDSTATLDVFFWKTSGATTSKIDSWSKGEGDVLNAKETFATEDVYPLQKDVQIDGLSVNLPHNPSALLKQQYGDDVMTKAYPRSLLISHAIPFMFKSFWLTKPIARWMS
jgi:hypothetical protein